MEIKPINKKYIVVRSPFWLFFNRKWALVDFAGKQIQQIFGLLHQLFNPLKPPKPPVDPAKLKSKIGFRPSN